MAAAVLTAPSVTSELPTAKAHWAITRIRLAREASSRTPPRPKRAIAHLPPLRGEQQES